MNRQPTMEPAWARPKKSPTMAGKRAVEHPYRFPFFGSTSARNFPV